MVKVIFLLIDGLGDVGIVNFSNMTPLQVAETPNLDTISRLGLNGLMDPVAPGLACGSDTAHMSLFGYDPWKYYRGRGAFESMGAGINMKPGDIAFKSNFATVDPSTGIVLSRRADRDFEMEGPIFCEYLNGTIVPSYPKYSATVKYATEHRCGVCISGPDLSDMISGTDPLRDGLSLKKCIPVPEHENCDRNAILTSHVVNSLSEHFHDLLSRHPLNAQRLSQGKPVANILLFRGAGIRLDIAPYEQLHGMRAFMIAPTCMISGLGMMVGMDIIRVPGASGDYNSDWMAKGSAAMKLLQGNDSIYDFGFVHIKAVDDAGHDSSLKMKIHCIEQIDKVVGKMLEMQTEPIVFIVTGDHSTPVFRGDHSNEPVPFSIAYLSPEGHKKLSGFVDHVEKFAEVSAAQGSLGRFSGDQVMPLVKSFLALVQADLDAIGS